MQVRFVSFSGASSLVVSRTHHSLIPTDARQPIDNSSFDSRLALLFVFSQVHENLSIRKSLPVEHWHNDECQLSLPPLQTPTGRVFSFVQLHPQQQHPGTYSDTADCVLDTGPLFASHVRPGLTP